MQANLELLGGGGGIPGHWQSMDAMAAAAAVPLAAQQEQRLKTSNFARLRKGYASMRKSFRTTTERERDNKSNSENYYFDSNVLGWSQVVDSLGGRLLRRGATRARAHNQHEMNANLSLNQRLLVSSASGGCQFEADSMSKCQEMPAFSDITRPLAPAARSEVERELERRLRRSKRRVLPSARYKAPNSQFACAELDLEQLESIKRDNLRLTLRSQKGISVVDKNQRAPPHDEQQQVELAACSCKHLANDDAEEARRRAEEVGGRLLCSCASIESSIETINLDESPSRNSIRRALKREEVFEVEESRPQARAAERADDEWPRAAQMKRRAISQPDMLLLLCSLDESGRGESRLVERQETRESRPVSRASSRSGAFSGQPQEARALLVESATEDASSSVALNICELEKLCGELTASSNSDELTCGREQRALVRAINGFEAATSNLIEQQLDLNVEQQQRNSEASGQPSAMMMLMQKEGKKLQHEGESRVEEVNLVSQARSCKRAANLHANGQRGPSAKFSALGGVSSQQSGGDAIKAPPRTPSARQQAHATAAATTTQCRASAASAAAELTSAAKPMHLAKPASLRKKQGAAAIDRSSRLPRATRQQQQQPTADGGGHESFKSDDDEPSLEARATREQPACATSGANKRASQEEAKDCSREDQLDKCDASLRQQQEQASRKRRQQERREQIMLSLRGGEREFWRELVTKQSGLNVAANQLQRQATSELSAENLYACIRDEDEATCADLTQRQEERTNQADNMHAAAAARDRDRPEVTRTESYDYMRAATARKLEENERRLFKEQLEHLRLLQEAGDNTTYSVLNYYATSGAGGGATPLKATSLGTKWRRGECSSNSMHQLNGKSGASNNNKKSSLLGKLKSLLLAPTSSSSQPLDLGDKNFWKNAEQDELGGGQVYDELSLAAAAGRRNKSTPPALHSAKSAQNLLNSSMRYLSASRKSVNATSLTLQRHHHQNMLANDKNNNFYRHHQAASIKTSKTSNFMSGFLTLGRRAAKVSNGGGGGGKHQAVPLNQLFEQRRHELEEAEELEFVNGERHLYGSVDSLPSADSGLSCSQLLNSSSCDENCGNYAAAAAPKQHSGGNIYSQAGAFEGLQVQKCNQFPSPPPTKPEGGESVRVLGVARASVDCNACAYDREALVFKRGDLIDILERGQSGTWLGRSRATGQVGHFKFISVIELSSDEQGREVEKSRASEQAAECKQKSLSLESVALAQKETPPVARKQPNLANSNENLMSSLEQLLVSIGLDSTSGDCTKKEEEEDCNGQVGGQQAVTCSNLSSSSYLSILNDGGICSLDAFSALDCVEQLEQIGIVDEEHKRRLLMAAKIIRQALRAAKADFGAKQQTTKQEQANSLTTSERAIQEADAATKTQANQSSASKSPASGEEGRPPDGQISSPPPPPSPLGDAIQGNQGARVAARTMRARDPQLDEDQQVNGEPIYVNLLGADCRDQAQVSCAQMNCGAERLTDSRPPPVAHSSEQARCEEQQGAPRLETEASQSRARHERRASWQATTTTTNLVSISSSSGKGGQSNTSAQNNDDWTRNSSASPNDRLDYDDPQRALPAPAASKGPFTRGCSIRVSSRKPKRASYYKPRRSLAPSNDLRLVEQLDNSDGGDNVSNWRHQHRTSAMSGERGEMRNSPTVAKAAAACCPSDDESEHEHWPAGHYYGCELETPLTRNRRQQPDYARKSTCHQRQQDCNRAGSLAPNHQQKPIWRLNLEPVASNHHHHHHQHELQAQLAASSTCATCNSCQLSANAARHAHCQSPPAIKRQQQQRPSHNSSMLLLNTKSQLINSKSAYDLRVANFSKFLDA